MLNDTSSHASFDSSLAELQMSAYTHLGLATQCPTDGLQQVVKSQHVCCIVHCISICGVSPFESLTGMCANWIRFDVDMSVNPLNLSHH